MFKVTTAHIKASGIVVVGTALVTAGSILGDVSMNDVSSFAGGGFSKFSSFLKTSGIVGIILTAIFIMVKFNVIKVLMIQEGETGMLIRRGKVVLDKTTGLPRLVNSDRYQLHVAVFRHIAIVSNRERTIELGPLPFTAGGETWVAPLAINWNIDGDAESMRDALIKVSDGNRFDEKFGALEAMIKLQSIAALALAFESAELSTTGGPPIVDFSLAEAELEKRANAYGSHFHELLQSPMHRFVGPYDGMKAIADAILQSPAALRSHLSGVPNAS